MQSFHCTFLVRSTYLVVYICSLFWGFFGLSRFYNISVLHTQIVRQKGRECHQASSSWSSSLWILSDSKSFSFFYFFLVVWWRGREVKSVPLDWISCFYQKHIRKTTTTLCHINIQISTHAYIYMPKAILLYKKNLYLQGMYTYG